jgi:FkbH-like protein
LNAAADPALQVTQSAPPGARWQLLNRFAANSRAKSALHASCASQLRRCAKVLRHQRPALLQALIQGTTHARENRFGDPPEQLMERVGDSLNLLLGHLEGSKDYGSLYIGQRIFELTQLERPRLDNMARYRRAATEEQSIYLAFLESHVDLATLESFKDAFCSLTAGLTGETSRHVRALFIGDCLLHEILSFAIGPLMDEGIAIDPFSINPRDPAQLERILDSLSTKTFDVILFSPFSHSRLPELARLLDPRMAFASRRQMDALVAPIISQTRDLLTAISQRFECPIFVHNAALVVRGSHAAKRFARLLLTHRARAMAGPRINQWLVDWVEAVNTATFRHIFVLDETELVGRFGLAALGRYLSTSRYQHSVVLSQHLAREYHSRIGAVGQLMGRKLVVCDLDNTLWDGLVGEGPVTHFEPRQRSLKRLKDNCGVVLSIASKNDPTKVHFSGCGLVEGDFVAPQISWGPKASAVGRIKASLNLQTRHMVFLDDRADERALVRETFSDILALDPCQPETWKRIGLWGDMTFGSSDVDRTRLYRQQQMRHAHLAAEPGHESADSAALQRLNLSLTISNPKRGELKRIAELINRTNQWNLCGTRTSFEQVRDWYGAEDVEILIASAADRFGDMGVVCVGVVTKGVDSARIGVFVLSCRAFGYGIESAMLAEIGRRCDIGGRRRALIGLHRATTQNQPCRSMYSDHGFAADGDGFEWCGSPVIREMPWLRVSCA